MKIKFNDATALSVKNVVNEGDYLSIKTIAATPEQLRNLFLDTTKTKRIIVEERGKQVAYEGFTSYHHTEEYPGGIYGIVMYKPEKISEAQEEISQAAILVAQIQAQSFTDEQALTVQAIYPLWDGNGEIYTAGHKVLYENTLYKCLQEHTSQEDWTPTAAPSLWAKVLIPDENTIPEWEQPDSTNGYAAGDKVTHNGMIYESLVDNNVWEPGITGTELTWQEV